MDKLAILASLDTQNLDDFSIGELLNLYDIADDDGKIAQLEDAIARKHGYANADEEWDATVSSPELAAKAYQERSNYTGRTKDEESRVLQSQPFYLAQPKVLPLDDASQLCDFCRHLDFSWIIHHLLPLGELLIGPLADIRSRKQCAFCRLIVASISQAMTECNDPLGIHDLQTEVGLMTQNKDFEASLFDMRVVLSSFELGRAPSIVIQQLAPMACSRPDYGRRIERTTVDLKTIRTWLTDCQAGNAGHHPPAYQSSLLDAYVPTHLIDVRQQCIVKGPSSNRYIVLSYVWGGPQNIQLTLQTWSLLSSPGALDSGRCTLPKTIRDAMALTENLNETYLWVDSLCIVQDDGQKSAQLVTKHKVFGNAILTIIAAAGDNAKSGLPGVRPNTIERHQHIETVQGLELANRLSTKRNTVENSVWSTRAWTYQERILSRRKLFISETQWTFLCEHTEVELCEDVHSQVHRPSEAIVSYKRQGRRHEIWNTSHGGLDAGVPYGSINTALYSAIVRRFTERNITDRSDILTHSRV